MRVRCLLQSKFIRCVVTVASDHGVAVSKKVSSRSMGSAKIQLASDLHVLLKHSGQHGVETFCWFSIDMHCQRYRARCKCSDSRLPSLPTRFARQLRLLLCPHLLPSHHRQSSPATEPSTPSRPAASLAGASVKSRCFSKVTSTLCSTHATLSISFIFQPFHSRGE